MWLKDKGQHGLSPRVRGNHPDGRVEEGFEGSIPACAGEPALWVCQGLKAEVYPRVCGGTSSWSV